MIPDAVDYLFSLRDAMGESIVFPMQSQVIIPNFPPLRTINYSITPDPTLEALLLYQYCFGEAMVPHAFDVKIQHSGGYVFNSIVSGQFTRIPTSTFIIISHQQPAVQITATNLRILVNYYELTFEVLGIRSKGDYNVILDALRRMHTSTRSETILQAIADKPPASPALPRPSLGGI